MFEQFLQQHGDKFEKMIVCDDKPVVLKHVERILPTEKKPCLVTVHVNPREVVNNKHGVKSDKPAARYSQRFLSHHPAYRKYDQRRSRKLIKADYEIDRYVTGAENYSATKIGSISAFFSANNKVERQNSLLEFKNHFQNYENALIAEKDSLKTFVVHSARNMLTHFKPRSWGQYEDSLQYIVLTLLARHPA
ncbi:MAG: hypothetical protein Q8R24_04850 [Legionellaceae bacterium]|nr:hypothetical protein [Legionellaceae bacterium]